MQNLTFSQNTYTTTLPLSLKLALADASHDAEDFLLDQNGQVAAEYSMEMLRDIVHLVPAVGDLMESLGVAGTPIHNAFGYDESHLFATGLIDWHVDGGKLSSDTRVLIFHPPCEGFRLQVSHATKEDYVSGHDLGRAMQGSEDAYLRLDMSITSGSIAMVDLNHYVRIIFDGDTRLLEGLPPILFFDVSYRTAERSDTDLEMIDTTMTLDLLEKLRGDMKTPPEEEMEMSPNDVQDHPTRH